MQHVYVVSPSERVPALDALRGLMALPVAVYHLGVWTRAFVGADVRGAVVVCGVYSVEGFFLISGFCFFHLYAGRAFDGHELWRFHIKRFFRIAPLYYFAMLLSIAFPIEQAATNVSAARVLENLSLSFGLIHPNHSLVLGGWSIGIEYVFYLVFPGLLWLARSRLALYALALMLLLWCVGYNLGPLRAAAAGNEFHAYVQLPNHAFLFLLGAIVADLRARHRVRIPVVGLLAALASLLTVAVLTQAPFFAHQDVMHGAARARYVTLCSLVVLLFAFTRWPSSQVRGPLGWLGERSYSVYLMHPFAWLLVESSLGAQHPALLRLLCGLCGALALAALSWRVLERPCNALGHKLAAHNPGSSPELPASTSSLP